MKLIADGFEPDEGAWMEKRFMCTRCDTVVEPGPEDKHLVEGYNDRQDYKSTLIMACPRCKRSTMWRECAIVEPLPPAYIPSFLQK